MFTDLKEVKSETTYATMNATAKIAKSSLYVSKPTSWLESRFHFSFAEYCDPKKVSFGPLFVLNDDLVKGKSGFGTHPHRNAEIFSYVVDGQLSHQDSMGNKEALSRGSVQYLSAGSGITHSEMNDGVETCRFLQVWIKPNQKGVKPQYGSQTHQKEERHNKLLHLIGGVSKCPDWPNMSPPSTIKLHQDCNVFATETDPNFSYDLTLDAGRQMYLVCIEGGLKINEDVDLTDRDAAELICTTPEPRNLNITASDKGMHFLAIEMTQN